MVDIAPSPALAPLDRAHDGVICFMEVAGSMFPLRGIAAANMPANKAHAQMYPFAAGLEALFASLSERFDILNLVEVGTCGCHTG